MQTIDIDNRLTSNYQRFYLNINRHKFDLWLMSLIPEDVTVYDRSAVTQIEDTGDAYTIGFYRDKKKRRYAPAISSMRAVRCRS